MLIFSTHKAMRLTVLGSGSAGNGYLLEGRTSALVIECGIPPERMFKRTGIVPSKIAGCLVSHEHGDHAGFAKRYAALGMTIFASMGTLSALGMTRDGSRARSIANMGIIHIGEFQVCAFELKHDAAEPFGFVITHPECGKILFVTDTRFVPFNFRRMRLDHIMVEANYSDSILDDNVLTEKMTLDRADRVRQTHMSLRSACELVMANDNPNLKTVTLLHLSSGNSDAKEFARQVAKSALLAEVYVAVAGLSIELKKNEI